MHTFKNFIFHERERTGERIRERETEGEKRERERRKRRYEIPYRSPEQNLFRAGSTG